MKLKKLSHKSENYNKIFMTLPSYRFHREIKKPKWMSSLYLGDILNNKRPLSTTEVIKLTEECSAAILNISLVKKKDPGCTTIDCSIGSQNFENAL